MGKRNRTVEAKNLEAVFFITQYLHTINHVISRKMGFDFREIFVLTPSRQVMESAQSSSILFRGVNVGSS